MGGRHRWVIGRVQVWRKGRGSDSYILVCVCVCVCVRERSIGENGVWVGVCKRVVGWDLSASRLACSSASPPFCLSSGTLILHPFYTLAVSLRLRLLAHKFI
jgi:hypothetical protein